MKSMEDWDGETPPVTVVLGCDRVEQDQSREGIGSSRVHTGNLDLFLQ